MKQIKRFQQLLLITVFIGSVFIAIGGVNPSTVFAAGCVSNPGNPTAADAQAACIDRFKSACKNDIGRDRFCESLTLNQINSCAKDGQATEFKQNCLTQLFAKEKSCYEKYDGNRRTEALLREYNNSECPSSKTGKCSIDTNAAPPQFKCPNPDAAGSNDDEPSGERTVGEIYTEGDCKDSFDQLNSENCGILKYIVLITNVLSGLAATIIVAMIILGGIQYSAAGADPSKVQAAKQKIYNALLALVLLVFGYAILQYLVPGGIF